MLESAIGGIAVPIFEQLWKVGGYAVDQMHEARQNVTATERVLKASQEYHNTYVERHGQVKVMPGLMKEPLPLGSIYTAVKFLDENSIRYFATQNDLEQTYRKQGKRSFQSELKRLDGMLVATKKQYLMVLGGPGVGKSTFLRKLGLEALKGKKGQLQIEKIPVLVELKNFRGKDINLQAVIAKEFEVCGFPNSTALTDSTLNQGKLLILLDGLDEVPAQNINQVIEHIEDFVTQNNKNTFVASCRTAAYHSSFKQFTDVTIADFDDEQIEQFIRRWFSSELDKKTATADRYWNLLQQLENAAAKELAQTPLLLTFLCLVYDREQTLPSTRSTLYGDALNILLKEWSAQKRLERDPIYEGFHPILEKELLSEIAYNSFKEDQLFFSKTDIIARINPFLEDTLDAPKNLDSEAVLKAIEVQQGILVARATDTYSFSHLTLQEYLTALYIVKNQLIEKSVEQYLTDKRWREVFLLVAGLLERRGHELLESIDLQAKALAHTDTKLYNLLQWADQITQNSLADYSPFEKRAFAIAIAIDTASETGMAKTQEIASTREMITAIIKTTRIVDAREVINNDIINAIANVKDIANARGAIDLDEIDFDIDAVQTGELNIVRAIIGINQLINFKIFSNQALKDLPTKILALKEKMPSSTASFNTWHSYGNELASIWLNAIDLFGLKTAPLPFSSEEWFIVSDYLYANNLLLLCQRSSIGISRRAWEVLEKNLLKL